MLYLAAQACTNAMTAEECAAGRTFPKLSRIREVSADVAVAVIEEGLRDGLCHKILQKHIDYGLKKFVLRKMYFPSYVPLAYDKKKIPSPL